MIQITPQMRIVAAVEPADFRRGIDGLARLCKDVLRHDPFRGWVFVFRNRSATALKVLVYDGQGFWLCHKRLSSGRFRWWPRCSTRRPRRWRPISCRFFFRRAIPKPRKPRRRGDRSGRRTDALSAGAIRNRVESLFTPFATSRYSAPREMNVAVVFVVGGCR